MNSRSRRPAAARSRDRIRSIGRTHDRIRYIAFRPRYWPSWIRRLALITAPLSAALWLLLLIATELAFLIRRGSWLIGRAWSMPQRFRHGGDTHGTSDRQAQHRNGFDHSDSISLFADDEGGAARPQRVVQPLRAVGGPAPCLRPAVAGEGLSDELEALAPDAPLSWRMTIKRQR